MVKAQIEGNFNKKLLDVIEVLLHLREENFSDLDVDIHLGSEEVVIRLFPKEEE